MIALLFILLFLVLMAAGIPVAFSMIATTSIYFLATGQPSELFVQRFASGLESFPLLAIPFFTLAGVVMARSGIAERLITFAESLVGHWRGGLAQVNVLNSIGIGGMSGSGSADAAIDSKILVPQMIKHGYPLPFSAAVTATSGIMSAIIPPSIVLILYGLQSGVSVGRLFIAGLVPALLMAVVLSIAVFFIARAKGYQPGKPKENYLAGVWSAFRYAFWSLMMPVLLLIGLRVGIFTPTELGAVAAVYTLVIALFVYKSLNFKGLLSVLREAATTTATIMIILAAAAAFGYFITVERLPNQILALISGVSGNPVVIVAILLTALLVIGMVLETSSLIIIAAPMIAPIAISIGMDPVQFGVMVVMALAIGGTTPPVGSVLYTVMSITGVKLGALAKAQLPFLLALIVALVLTAAIPAISLFLPALFYGS